MMQWQTSMTGWDTKKNKDINSVMLIGGGTLSHYLLGKLMKRKNRLKL